MSERRFLLREGYVTDVDDKRVSMAVSVEAVAVVAADVERKRLRMLSDQGTHLASIDWPEHVDNAPDAMQWFFDAVMPSW